jgi:hypothetical protein
MIFYFNRPHDLDADSRSRGVWKFRGVFEKEPRSNGHTSYQVDRHGYLPEVKIEISEQMFNHTNNSSARSAIAEKLGSNQRLAGDLI